jgi:CRP-like cAMP-binding protein
MTTGLAIRRKLAERRRGLSATDSKLGRLAELPFFAGCAKAELSVAARLTEETVVPAGAVLTEEGSADAFWYSVRSGTAGVTRGGRPTTVFGPGDWWGEAPILCRRPATVSVVAVTPMVVVTANRRQFLAMLDMLPGVAHRLLRSLACWEPPYQTGRWDRGGELVGSQR